MSSTSPREIASAAAPRRFLDAVRGHCEPTAGQRHRPHHARPNSAACLGRVPTRVAYAVRGRSSERLPGRLPPQARPVQTHVSRGLRQVHIAPLCSAHRPSLGLGLCLRPILPRAAAGPDAPRAAPAGSGVPPRRARPIHRLRTAHPARPRCRPRLPGTRSGRHSPRPWPRRCPSPCLTALAPRPQHRGPRVVTARYYRRPLPPDSRRQEARAGPALLHRRRARQHHHPGRTKKAAEVGLAARQTSGPPVPRRRRRRTVLPCHRPARRSVQVFVFRAAAG